MLNTESEGFDFFKAAAYLKGRGAQINPSNRFDNYIRDANPLTDEEDGVSQLQTQLTTVHPKTIVNEVVSPDIPMDYSANPYQGCEHGCVYCYARNTHPYWGYSAGVDFERKIMVKKNAAELLEARILHPKWKAKPIMFSGNTDCYQPVERKMKITRAMLEVLWKYRHPVGIITKNSLILRDLGLLQKMAKEDLVKVNISITTMDEKLRSFMEPRTATIKERLKTVELLTANGIPTQVLMAPVIPGLNDHEILKLIEACAKAGALDFHHGIVRLNGEVQQIFIDWIQKTYPAKADKVINKIKECHGGDQLESYIGNKMTKSKTADIIRKQVALGKKKFFEGRTMPTLNCEIHDVYKTSQLKLF
ncbi:MAG: PA0069 family radical SAM protein [Saprospiraceae bacterium]